MAGTLYGIGVGPGDPELLTLKAVRLMQACSLLAVPAAKKGLSVAYRIAVQAAPQIAGKTCLELEMPMTKDKESLERSHQAAFTKLQEALEQGEDVGFLTLGDPCIYSTYLYMHKRAVQAGFHTEIVSGIPSFCAVSAKLGQGLAEQSQMLHIIPSTYGVEEGLKLPGTKILMKPGKKLGDIREALLRDCAFQEVAMIENCGMEQERIYRSAEEIPEQAGYYSLMVVKGK